ncbi:MAG: plsC 4, partial [Mycobacterium sp.]|nr:plsC 4 [Mycobacterium sp.]
VDVAVFPPIPVDDWTTENLSERIAEVRQLYLDTLKNWPQGDLPSAPLYERTAKPTRKAPAKKAATKSAAKKAAAAKAPVKKAAAKANPAKKGRP